MNESFGKKEKLKSKIIIDKLFAEGKSVKKFPMLLIYLPLSEESKSFHNVGVSVPKRNHKKAVDRIKLKRLMREAYRKNKYLVNTSLDSHYAFMFIYIGREIVSYSKIVSTTRELLKSLVEKETK